MQSSGTCLDGRRSPVFADPKWDTLATPKLFKPAGVFDSRNHKLGHSMQQTYDPTRKSLFATGEYLNVDVNSKDDV